jgi:hypothetical protein
MSAFFIDPVCHRDLRAAEAIAPLAPDTALGADELRGFVREVFGQSLDHPFVAIRCFEGYRVIS